MKIGISTASLYPLETEKALEFLGQNKIPVTEIFFNSPSEYRAPFVKRLAEIARYYGTKVASVHPCGSVGEPYFLFNDYERRYREAFEEYKRYYEAAAILGAETVVIHGDSFSGHVSDEKYCARLMEMNEAAKQFGVCISHENVSHYRAATPERIIKFRELTADELKFTFDVKQSVRAGCNVYDMYNAMNGNIVNVHISDHLPKSDCMLPGRGGFDFGALFNRLEKDGYKGACLIEVYRYAYKQPAELIEAYRYVKNFHE